MSIKIPNSNTLTKAEETVMQALWGIPQPALVRDIIAAIPDKVVHANTVNTMLKILAEKGFVTSSAVGNANQYSAVVSKEDYSRTTMKSFMQRYFDGSFTSLVSFFAADKSVRLDEVEELLKAVRKLKKQ